jgi:hypothetical protein
MKTTRIQLGIEWVRGPLKFQLMMTTVTRMLTVFMMKVNSKYCTHTHRQDNHSIDPIEKVEIKMRA